MDWDDLKVLLALSRKGSARGAAQLLQVSNSTVVRRLDDMERQLGTRLFDRTPEGYRKTVGAEQLLPTAEHVEELVLAAERQITGGDQELEGTIRLTMPDLVAHKFLIHRLAVFAERYPLIELELLPSYEQLDLSRREADIAIRVMPKNNQPPDYLIGRKVVRTLSSVFVHRDLVPTGSAEEVAALTWIGRENTGQAERWRRDSAFPEHPSRHFISNIILQVEAVKAGMGMCQLPVFAVRDVPEIVAVPGAPVRHLFDLWVLSHRDLRLSARMRVLREFLVDEFRHSGYLEETGNFYN
jgi:DNA-binding transcriptional LysR family regulator